MNDEASVQLTFTPEEVSILGRALRAHYNQQQRRANKYQDATGNNPAVSHIKRTKALMRRLEDMAAEHGIDLG